VFCLVRPPLITHRVPTPPSRLGQQRREPPHPPVKRHLVHVNPPGKQHLHIAVGQTCFASDTTDADTRVRYTDPPITSHQV